MSKLASSLPFNFSYLFLTVPSQVHNRINTMIGWNLAEVKYFCKLAVVKMNCFAEDKSHSLTFGCTKYFYRLSKALTQINKSKVVEFHTVHLVQGSIWLFIWLCEISFVIFHVDILENKVFQVLKLSRNVNKNVLIKNITK